MEGCDLTGADLTDCNLTGTKMRGADLHQATYNVEEFCKTGWLQGTHIGAVDWSGRNLRDALLAGADLRGADLQDSDLTNADLQGCQLDGSSIKGVTLTGARFDVLSFSEKGWLRGAKLGCVDWSKLDLTGADLKEP